MPFVQDGSLKQFTPKPVQTLAITRALNYVPFPHVSPLEEIILLHTQTLPEGVTLSLMAQAEATFSCRYCGLLELNLTRVDVGSNVNASAVLAPRYTYTS